MQIPYTITLIYDTLYSHFKKQLQYSNKKYVIGWQNSPGLRYRQPHTRMTAYQQSFFPASIKLWSLAPTDIVSRLTIDAVRRGLALSPDFSSA